MAATCCGVTLREWGVDKEEIFLRKDLREEKAVLRRELRKEHEL